MRKIIVVVQRMGEYVPSVPSGSHGLLEHTLTIDHCTGDKWYMFRRVPFFYFASRMFEVSFDIPDSSKKKNAEAKNQVAEKKAAARGQDDVYDEVPGR